MNGYGRNVRDPIRVSGFYEEKRYLECLRETGRYVPLKYERLGSCRSDSTGHPVDVYRLGVKGLFRRPVLLYIDIYAERDWRAPEGYMLIDSAPENDEADDGKKLADALMKAIEIITK